LEAQYKKSQSEDGSVKGELEEKLEKKEEAIVS
jgi:hypothetical protein